MCVGGGGGGGGGGEGAASRRRRVRHRLYRSVFGACVTSRGRPGGWGVMNGDSRPASAGERFRIPLDKPLAGRLPSHAALLLHLPGMITNHRPHSVFPLPTPSALLSSSPPLLVRRSLPIHTYGRVFNQDITDSA